MSQLKIDTYKLERYADRLSSVNRRLNQLDRRMDALYWRAGLLDLWNLIQADLLTGYSWRLKRCQGYLQDTARDFEKLERKLASMDPAKFKAPKGSLQYFCVFRQKGSWNDNFKSPKFSRAVMQTLWTSSDIITSEFKDATKKQGHIRPRPLTEWKEWIEVIFDELENGRIHTGHQQNDEEPLWDILNKRTDIHRDALGVIGIGSIGSVLEDTKLIGKYVDTSLLGDKKHFDVNRKQDEQRNEDWQVNQDEKWYKQKGTILEDKDEIRLEGSVYEGLVHGNSESAEGSAGIKVLNGETHASFTKGLYVYEKDKNGNIKRIFSPGVSAEVGASVSALTLTADGRIGLGKNKDMLGLYGDAEVEVLSAEAKAKFAVNRNEIYAGAKAEANVAKVTGTAGVSVLGTDVGVTGSAKIGIGAHAEVGYTDGKLKVDVGAAIGVGFDLGFEVDVSGTVDAVSDCAEAAWDDISDVASDVWNFLF